MKGPSYHISPKLNARLFVVCILWLCTSAFAQKVGWHPQFSGYLGSGLDFRNQDAPKRPVAVLDTNQPIFTPSNGDAQFTAQFAQSKLDIARGLGINSSLSVKGFAVSGSIGVDFVDRQTFSANTLSFVFEGRRDFGETRYRTAIAEPEFVSRVQELKRTLRGSLLERAIRDRYGSHYISGYRNVARVVVVYTFDFKSRSRTQSLRTSVAASYSGVDFEATVSSFLAQSERNVSLRYRFESSDPDFKPDFALGFGSEGEITTFQGFREFSEKVKNYLYSMPRERAKVVEFVAEPLMNLPNFDTLVGSDTEVEKFNTSYEGFVDEYSRLKAWQQILRDWTIERDRMHWLNAQGQQFVRGMYEDVNRYVAVLEQTARDHFANGTSLEIPRDIHNYFAKLNEIPLPKLGLVQHGIGCGEYWTFGYIAYGAKDLTTSDAFRTLIALKDGDEVEAPGVPIYYSVDEFEQRLRHVTGKGGLTSCPLTGQELERFSSSSTWTLLKDDAKNCRVGFFLFPGIGSLEIGGNHWTLAIKDRADSIVDEVNMVSHTSASPCSPPAEVSSIGSGLSLNATIGSTNAVLGAVVSQRFTVQNPSPNAAYGVRLAFPLDPGFEFGGATGSQGHGAFTNSTVVYEVGPLAAGATAHVEIRFIPLKLGSQRPTTSAEATLGEGLTDFNPSDNQVALPSIEVVPPGLAATRKGDFVQLSWNSDTSRMVVEEALSLNATGKWTLSADNVEVRGSQRHLLAPTSERQKFYRLRIH